jgi:hypothetical protein
MFLANHVPDIVAIDLMFADGHFLSLGNATKGKESIIPPDFGTLPPSPTRSTWYEDVEGLG